MRKGIRIAVGLLAAALAACAQAPQGPRIRIENAWARPGAMAMGEGMGHGMGHGMSHAGGASTSAAFFVVVNEGDAPDALVGAASDVARSVEVHETVMEGDVAKMRPVPRVEIPARGRVAFQPRGLHVMLIDLTRSLNVGDTFTLTLRFERSGEIPVTVAVREMNP